MIQINLLPGATRKTRGPRGVQLNFGGALTTVAARIKDPYLISAVAAVLVCAFAIAGMFWYQGTRASALAAEVQTAEQDSIRFAAIIKEKRKTEAQVDSVQTQLRMIESIDGKRFVWSHIMDEVSRSLPAYTWLTQLVQTNVTEPMQPVSELPDEKATGKNAKVAAEQRADSIELAQRVNFRLIGNTVDIQALTRFMRLLEASPFVEDVQLIKSSLIIVEGKEVTEFTLDASYQTPDSSAIRTVPLTVAVR